MQLSPRAAVVARLCATAVVLSAALLGCGSTRVAPVPSPAPSPDAAAGAALGAAPDRSSAAGTGDRPTASGEPASPSTSTSLGPGPSSTSPASRPWAEAGTAGSGSSPAASSATGSKLAPPATTQPATTQPATASSAAAPKPAPPASAPPATAATDAEVVASRLAALVAGERASRGLPALTRDARIDAVARDWSRQLASAGLDLAHNPDYAAQVPAGWTAVGENVAWLDDGGTLSAAEVAQRLHDQWMASPGHRANILGSYTHLGVGVAHDPRYGWYATQDFARY